MKHIRYVVTVAIIVTLMILSACYALDIFGKHHVRRVEGKIYENGGFTFTGGLLDGLFDGYGVMIFENGDKYRGYFANGRFEGRGTYIFADGSVYAGVFTAGRFADEQD